MQETLYLYVKVVFIKIFIILGVLFHLNTPQLAVCPTITTSNN